MIFNTARSFMNKKNYRNLLFSTVAVLLLGIFGFKYLEKWSWIDCVNYSVSTMVTTGNAGVIPITKAGKIFNIFYMFTSVILILIFINTITQHFRDVRKTKDFKHERHQKIAKDHVSESIKSGIEKIN
ncbi:MAG: two pore domain potassium channel family protein [Chryseobacterium sp.]|nr:two pore domain potassium channel family protein [Chryseobacterium sp.]